MEKHNLVFPTWPDLTNTFTATIFINLITSISVCPRASFLVKKQMTSVPVTELRLWTNPRARAVLCNFCIYAFYGQGTCSCKRQTGDPLTHRTPCVSWFVSLCEVWNSNKKAARGKVNRPHAAKKKKHGTGILPDSEGVASLSWLTKNHRRDL